MSLKTRYDFIKRKHKNYLVLFNEKNRYFSCDQDKELLQDLRFWNNLKDLEKKQISYMIFTNVVKIKTFDAQENNYRKYCKILKVKKMIAILTER